jgi:hypothetical protein
LELALCWQQGALTLEFARVVLGTQGWGMEPKREEIWHGQVLALAHLVCLKFLLGTELSRLLAAD